jgi:hypothetical protein
MRRVGFEPTIPVIEQAETVHDLDHATTVIGYKISFAATNLCVQYMNTNTNGRAKLQRAPLE